MKEKSVNVHLSVNVSGDFLIANLRFLNNSNKEVYLDSQTICFDNKTRRNVFEIHDEQDGEIKYTGAYVYREVVTQDYVKLGVGETLESKIELNGVYNLTKGHKYTIQYSVIHPSYKDDAGFTHFESNKVEISY